MKRFLLTLTLIAITLSLDARGSVIERTYVATDRDVYVAGDWMWCSVFTMNVADGIVPTGMSSTVYLELHSAEQMVATAKIALMNGRGAGRIDIPNTLPTGNYRLIAYTALNKDEINYNYDNIWSKTISIFNVFSSERIPGGVNVLKSEEYEAIDSGVSETDCGIELERNESADAGYLSFNIKNLLSDASVSISVYNDDGIVSYNNSSIADFALALNSAKESEVKYNVIPDYEGEVVYGRFVGADAKGLSDIRDTYAILAVPGDGSDCYLSQIQDDGSVQFFTGNIYGDKEAVCEIAGLDSLSESHLELSEPFVDAAVASIRPLDISEAIAASLTSRAIAMQIEQKFTSDTLFEYLPTRSVKLFSDDVKSYNLDDYTRFPLMEEVFTEFIRQVRLRKVDGHTEAQILMEDRRGDPYYSEGMSLMMLDGVPVFDHGKLFAYDPLLVERIDIYPQIYCIGGKEFMGIINFTTYKKNLPSMTFEHNVRIVNFQGVSYPMAYTCASIAPVDSYPDYRQTIYWHPLINLRSGESFTVNCPLPDYEGSYRVVVEGITSDGQPLIWRGNL